MNKPSWYITPKEFANLVVETMEDLQYFKADELCHPEDIVATFQTVAEALAKGMGYTGRQINKTKQAKPFSQTVKEGLLRSEFNKEYDPNESKSLINSYINKL